MENDNFYIDEYTDGRKCSQTGYRDSIFPKIESQVEVRSNKIVT